MMTGMPASFAVFTDGLEGGHIRRSQYDRLDTAVDGTLDNVDLFIDVALGLSAEEGNREFRSLLLKLCLGSHSASLHILPETGVAGFNDNRNLATFRGGHRSWGGSHYDHLGGGGSLYDHLRRGGSLSNDDRCCSRGSSRSGTARQNHGGSHDQAYKNDQLLFHFSFFSLQISW